ncbi:hypothetical protein SAMN05428995_11510 [Loktanella sp. DSM 29012]|uniref:hypothetical protein n=1 Tax=Loktanella sp. DSM 29012 TaxID=1881056 RepID=UPI0008B61A90|nr:hypothetical protein [Loktanella sp. DSM 29012]SEQ88317.1 hypothetical protein SAMN05428995_11510 [Loktanella sp. DSM 29012]
MKNYLLAMFAFVITSCATYPDISSLSPQDALASLSSYEAQLDEGEANLRSGPVVPAPPGAFIAAGEAMAPALTQIGLENIAADRSRLASDRERIYQANPSLRPPASAQVDVAGVGMSGNLSTSGLCGFSAGDVTDAKRNVLHAEASKSPNFNAPFQTARQVTAEYNRTGAQGCNAIGQQFEASMNGFRSAMSTADQLNNGPSRGIQCDPTTGSASSASYCAATALLYSAQTVSALCHEVCN